jgi:hypothetical protein
MNANHYILENGEQFDLTTQQVDFLLKQGLIYDAGEYYYHITEGQTYSDIELALKGVSL